MRPLNFISKILKKKTWQFERNDLTKIPSGVLEILSQTKFCMFFVAIENRIFGLIQQWNKKLIHTDYLFLFAYAENILQLNLNFELIRFRDKKNQNYVDVYEKIVDYTEKLKQKKIIIQQTNLLQLNVTTHFFSESN